MAQTTLELRDVRTGEQRICDAQRARELCATYGHVFDTWTHKGWTRLLSATPRLLGAEEKVYVLRNARNWVLATGDSYLVRAPPKASDSAHRDRRRRLRRRIQQGCATAAGRRLPVPLVLLIVDYMAESLVPICSVRPRERLLEAKAWQPVTPVRWWTAKDNNTPVQQGAEAAREARVPWVPDGLSMAEVMAIRPVARPLASETKEVKRRDDEYPETFKLPTSTPSFVPGAVRPYGWDGIVFCDVCGKTRPLTLSAHWNCPTCQWDCCIACQGPTEDAMDEYHPDFRPQRQMEFDMHRETCLAHAAAFAPWARDPPLLPPPKCRKGHALRYIHAVTRGDILGTMDPGLLGGVFFGAWSQEGYRMTIGCSGWVDAQLVLWTGARLGRRMVVERDSTPGNIYHGLSRYVTSSMFRRYYHRHRSEWPSWAEHCRHMDDCHPLVWSRAPLHRLDEMDASDFLDMTPGGAEFERLAGKLAEIEIAVPWLLPGDEHKAIRVTTRDWLRARNFVRSASADEAKFVAEGARDASELDELRAAPLSLVLERDQDPVYDIRTANGFCMIGLGRLVLACGSL